MLHISWISYKVKKKLSYWTQWNISLLENYTFEIPTKIRCVDPLTLPKIKAGKAAHQIDTSQVQYDKFLYKNLVNEYC